VNTLTSSENIGLKLALTVNLTLNP